MAERPSWLKQKAEREEPDSNDRSSPRPQPKAGFTRRGSGKPTTPSHPPPNGFKRRAPHAEPPPEEAPAPEPPRHHRPLPRRKRKHEKPRPLDLDSVCLGVITVVRATDKGIQVTGGDTTGENWLPRSYILDGRNPDDLDRDADVGHSGELWLPRWLADKVPW